MESIKVEKFKFGSLELLQERNELWKFQSLSPYTFEDMVDAKKGQKVQKKAKKCLKNKKNKNFQKKFPTQDRCS